MLLNPEPERRVEHDLVGQFEHMRDRRQRREHRQHEIGGAQPDKTPARRRLRWFQAFQVGSPPAPHADIRDPLTAWPNALYRGFLTGSTRFKTGAPMTHSATGRRRCVSPLGAYSSGSVVNRSG